MYRKGHYGVALLVVSPAGLALALAGWPGVAVAGGAGVVWLAMLPDLDRRVPGLPHRGPTHSLAFAGVAGPTLGVGGFAAGRAAGMAPLALAAAGVGVGVATVLAHLLADALTPAGVPL